MPILFVNGHLWFFLARILHLLPSLRPISLTSDVKEIQVTVSRKKCAGNSLASLPPKKKVQNHVRQNGFPVSLSFPQNSICWWILPNKHRKNNKNTQICQNAAKSQKKKTTIRTKHEPFAKTSKPAMRIVVPWCPFSPFAVPSRLAIALQPGSKWVPGWSDPI